MVSGDRLLLIRIYVTTAQTNIALFVVVPQHRSIGAATILLVVAILAKQLSHNHVALGLCNRQIECFIFDDGKAPLTPFVR